MEERIYKQIEAHLSSSIKMKLDNIRNYLSYGNASAIHNGLEYVKANMKLSVLQDNQHTDEDKEKRLKQIDIDIHHMEEILRNDLEYRGLLAP